MRSDDLRVDIFRRILKQSDSEILKALSSAKKDVLLKILNSTVLPNSITKDSLKYSYFFNLLLSKSKKEKEKLKKSLRALEDLTDVLSPSEKSVIKFGLFRGFYGPWEENMRRFTSLSVDPQKEGRLSKKISSHSFLKIFELAKKIVGKGERGERFPRL